MAINERAPVVAASKIEVAAAPETVWEVMAAIDRWPSWNPDVKEAHLGGPLAAGSRFRWKSGPGTITSTLLRVERPRILAWTGTTFGIKRSTSGGWSHATARPSSAQKSGGRDRSRVCCGAACNGC